MSAYTSAYLYRPGPPPQLTTGDLADFIEAVRDLGLLRDDNCPAVHLKFGRAIDQDEKPTYPDPPEDAVVYRIKEPRRDVSLQNAPLGRVIEMLRSPLKARRLFARSKNDQRIYRAMLLLGELRPDIVARVTRQGSEENRDPGLSLSDLGLEIGPLRIFDDEKVAHYFVGWMYMSVSGYGYVFPWTHEDILAKLKACEPLQQLRELCRSRWPVPSVEVTPEIVETRRQSGRLWAGDDYNAPPDWRWAIDQSY